MRSETRTIYTLAELRQHRPEAYKRVLARWADDCQRDPDVPCADETMDSLRAVVKACGATLKDSQVGPYYPSSIRVECENVDDDGRTKDADWLLANVLAPHGYVKDGAACFPGLCAWTGYCADDAMIERVHAEMLGGATLKRALESLACLAQREMEDNCEQMAGEESMLANWEGCEYDEDGNEV